METEIAQMLGGVTGIIVISQMAVGFIKDLAPQVNPKFYRPIAVLIGLILGLLSGADVQGIVMGLVGGAGSIAVYQTSRGTKKEATIEDVEKIVSSLKK